MLHVSLLLLAFFFHRFLTVLVLLLLFSYCCCFILVVLALVSVPSAACPFCYCCVQCSWRLAVAGTCCLSPWLLLAPCHVVGAFADTGVHAVANFPAVTTLLLFLAILFLLLFVMLTSATNWLAFTCIFLAHTQYAHQLF
jgi:hypothetical protein